MIHECNFTDDCDSRLTIRDNLFSLTDEWMNGWMDWSIGSRPSDHYFRSVCLFCLFVCLSVCLFVQSFFSRWRNFRFCKSCRRAMRFSPLDSSDDFMRRCGLRFCLSLIVSELWRHNDVISTHRQSEKNLLSSNTSSRCPHNMVNFGPLAAEIVSLVWGTAANFKGFRVLAALLHGTPAAGVSHTLRRWTEVVTYIRQGGHHVGHWPTL